MKRETTGYLLITIAILLFSTIEVVHKSIASKVDPVELTFMRILMGAVIVRLAAPVLEHRQARGVRLHPRDLTRMGLTGLVGIAVSLGALHMSVVGLHAYVAATIFSSNPLFVALFAYALLRESMTKRKMIGLLIGLIGVALLRRGGAGELRYYVYALIGAVGFALYLVMFKLWGQKWGRVRATYGTFGFGAFFLGVWVLMRGGPFTPAANWLATWPQMLYLAAIATGVGYICYLEGMSRVEASRGAAIFYLKPVVSTVLALSLLEEPLSGRMGFGAALVVVGLYLALKRPSHRGGDGGRG